MLFSKRTIEYAIAVAAGVAPLWYFFGFSLLSTLTILIYGALAFYALRHVRDELKSRINFNTIILLRQGVPLLLTALSLAFAAAYFIETSRAPERITIRDIIPPSLGNAIISRVNPSTFNATLSVDEYYELILSRSDQLFASYRAIIPVTFAIGFFLFLRTVAFPYGWLILWISAGMVKALRRTGIVLPLEEQTKKEWLEWA
ncbi:MAG: hypothetical protein G01um101429_233 [Parcubacteria group bacterium Gr01-1014_29]|nr:MAG: hypothetical protein G01um101429_233 [Parcubacteria group bacterium Gr01-1014_29]